MSEEKPKKTADKIVETVQEILPSPPPYPPLPKMFAEPIYKKVFGEKKE